MTALDLYHLTQPLFDKHPSAKPECLGTCSPSNALIIQGHLVQWLLNKKSIANNAKRNLHIDISENAIHEYRYCVESDFGPTLLHALVAACMEIEK